MATSRDGIDDVFYSLIPTQPMVTWVDQGAPVRLHTRDASGDQFREGFDHGDTVVGELFPVTGPVGLRGAHSGDTIAIDVLGIQPAATGHTWTRRGLGYASPTDFHVRALSSSTPSIDWGYGPAIEITPRPHLGTLGLIPKEHCEPRSLGRYGGNVDTVHLGEGSTLWLTAQVDGAGVFTGDVHASIGAAEVCGTGIEVAAVVDLALRVHDGWKLELPTLRSNGKIWLLSDGDSFDEALETAVRACTTLLARSWGMSVKDAYLAVGLLLEVDICQVVNPRRSLAVSLSGGADIALGPDWRHQ